MKKIEHLKNGDKCIHWFLVTVFGFEIFTREYEYVKLSQNPKSLDTT